MKKKNLKMKVRVDERGDISPYYEPWWIVVLKVLAYAIGLILAGYGSDAAATNLFLL